MRYHLPARELVEGFSLLAQPPQADLERLAVGQLHLGSLGAQHHFATDDRELCIDILAGACSADLHGPWGEVSYSSIGNRRDPFSGPPTILYVPRQTRLKLTCTLAPLDAVTVTAHSARDLLPVLIRGSDVQCEVFGSANSERRVYLSVGPSVEADRIMMGETHTPSGNWSSYPPHKHDVDSDQERSMEEIYHFVFDPPHGFGMQYLWTDPEDRRPRIDEAYALHTGDTVVIPRGYHPTVVAPGFRMVTVFAFAGEKRAWAAWSVNQGFLQDNGARSK